MFFTDFAEFSDKKYYYILKELSELVTSKVRDQDATAAQARHG